MAISEPKDQADVNSRLDEVKEKLEDWNVEVVEREKTKISDLEASKHIIWLNETDPLPEQQLVRVSLICSTNNEIN